MISMVLLEPMVVFGVAQVALEALMELALVVSKISSQVSLVAVASTKSNAPRQGDDLQYRVNLKFEEAILVLKRKLSTIGKRLVVHVADQVLSQGQVQ